MSRIKGKDTKPEILLRKLLFAAGYRYRLNDKKLPGKPDIVLKKYKTVIFVNGCFWHGHKDCKYFSVPKTRTEFWTDKINGNIVRDSENEETLKMMGWKVITVWECGLKKNRLENTFQKILDHLLQLSYKNL